MKYYHTELGAESAGPVYDKDKDKSAVRPRKRNYSGKVFVYNLFESIRCRRSLYFWLHFYAQERFHVNKLHNEYSLYQKK